MHDERDSIELYKKHEKEVKQRVVMDLLKVFDEEDMLNAAIWKLLCKCLKEHGIPWENRKEFIYSKVDEVLKKWL